MPNPALWLVLAALGCPKAPSVPSSRSPLPDTPVARYEITGALVPDLHRLTVSGTVHAPPSDDGVLTVVVPVSAGPVQWSTPDGPVAAEPALGKKGTWSLKIDGPVDLSFSYETRTPAASGFFYVGPEMCFGSGAWYPVIDDLPAVGTVAVTAPDRWGVVVGETSLPGALWFAARPGAPFARAQAGTTLFTLVRRATDDALQDGIDGVLGALEHHFGPAPYGPQVLIEVPNPIATVAGFGAFAAPGALFARSSLLDQTFNVPAFAHEIAHEWWGHAVRLEGTRGDFLLDEGLAQYGAIVAVDRMLGDEAGARYRREGFQGFNPELYSAIGYLKLAAAGLDHPLSSLPDDGLSSWLAYSKAGLVWYALAQHVGPERFRAALLAVVARYGSRSVTWEQFLAEIEAQAPGDVAPFVAAWFDGTGAPELTLDWSQSGNKLSAQVTSEPPWPGTVELAVDGRVERVPLGTRVRIPTTGPVAKVELDPSYRLLHWTPELHAEADALADAMKATSLARDGKPEEAEQVLATALTASTSNAFDRRITMAATLVRLCVADNDGPCATSALEQALAEAPVQLDELALTYLGLANAAGLMERPELQQKAAELALQADALVSGANGVVFRLE